MFSLGHQTLVYLFIQRSHNFLYDINWCDKTLFLLVYLILISIRKALTNKTFKSKLNKPWLLMAMNQFCSMNDQECYLDIDHQLKNDVTKV